MSFAALLLFTVMNVLKYWAKCSKGKVFTEETGGHRRLIQQGKQIQEGCWQKQK